MRKAWVGPLVFLGAMLAACADDGRQACVPGSTQACLCPGGSRSAQVCGRDGTSWLACACSDGGAGGDVVLPVVDAACAVPLTICGAVCTDTSSDPSNCGGCDARCGSGAVCRAGACVAMCSGGRVACDGNCVDTSTDIANCGGCGNACPAAQDCIAGACVGACSAGRLHCPSPAGPCADVTSDTANCGACGFACPSGQRCSSGTCAVPSPPVTVTWSFPGYFATGGLEVFPTYLARLYDPAPALTGLSFRFVMACATLHNTTSSAQSVDLTVSFPSFASDGVRTVSVPVGRDVQQCFDPLFNWSALGAVRATTPAGVQVRAAITGGAALSAGMHPFTVLASNAIVWTPQSAITGGDMQSLSAVFVRPNDPDVLSLRSEAERLSGFTDGFGVAPSFQHTMPLSWAFPVDNYAQDTTFLESGETLTVVVDSVSGGTSDTVSTFLFNTAQYRNFMAGTSIAAVQMVVPTRSGSRLTYTSTADDWYYLVFANARVNASTGEVQVDARRSSTFFDAAADVAQATFLAVRNRGVSYSNVASVDLAGLQYIRTPSEVLAMGAGNCIEGTLLFASVFEQVGFRPFLDYFTCPGFGHAIVSVAAPNGRIHWPIETTAVGARATTPAAAIAGAIGTESSHSMCSHTTDVRLMRAAHITPGM